MVSLATDWSRKLTRKQVHETRQHLALLGVALPSRASPQETCEGERAIGEPAPWSLRSGRLARNLPLDTGRLLRSDGCLSAP